METSLHRQLKQVVARDASSIEVIMGSYRIDAIDSHNRLVEVQHAGLGSIRRKVLEIREEHELRVIKPIIVSKRIVNLDPKTRDVISTRRSPKKFHPLAFFTELIHFTVCFPHPNLTLECWETHITETRIAKSRHRFRRKRYQVVDQTLDQIGNCVQLRTAADLVAQLPLTVTAEPFDTQQLGLTINIERWFAQQIAYVLYHCGAAERVGKSGNAHLYRWTDQVLRALTPTTKRRRTRKLRA